MARGIKLIRGNDRINRLAQRPDIAADVAQIRADMAEADRTYAMGLAALRQAAEFTQVELARRMGVTQAAISRMEHNRQLRRRPRGHPRRTDVTRRLAPGVCMNLPSTSHVPGADPGVPSRHGKYPVTCGYALAAGRRQGSSHVAYLWTAHDLPSTAASLS